jgi:hypothetical protein
MLQAGQDLHLALQAALHPRREKPWPDHLERRRRVREGYESP